MNEPLIVALAICRWRTLDQPHLASHLTPQSAWRTWAPAEAPLDY